MKNQKSFIILATSLILITVFLTSCIPKPNPDDTAVSPTPKPSVVIETPEPTPSEPPEPTPPPFRNPLSGTPLEIEHENLRPYAIMINNLSVALPHMGVSKADIIYEALAEGEITRMLAIFSDITDVGILGSMRSARPYYIEIARSYDAIFVHAGGSEQAYTDIYAKGVNSIDGVRGAYGGQIFYRDPARAQHGYEHSLFTTSELLHEYMPILGYKTHHAQENFNYGLTFDDDIDMTGGVSAEQITVSFAGLKTTNFTYDGEKFYTASQYDIDYIDGTTTESVLFRNVLVLYASTQIIDNEGRRTVNLTGTGTGHYICNGKMLDINWSRAANGEIFTYTLTDGTPLILAAGQSYIGIVPTGSTTLIQ